MKDRLTKGLRPLAEPLLDDFQPHSAGAVAEAAPSFSDSRFTVPQSGTCAPEAGGPGAVGRCGGRTAPDECSVPGDYSACSSDSGSMPVARRTGM